MIDWLRSETLKPIVEIDGRDLPVELCRNKRARRLTLRLAPDGSAVRITLPQWCASREAIAFAHARRDWLATQLAKVPPRRDPVEEGRLLYRGREIELEWCKDAPRKPVLTDDRLTLGGARETLARRLHRWLETEAALLFAEDARDYCSKAAVDVAAVKLTRARRRWGSCSSEGVLRLNWRLVQAPDHVRRSVVAHEVAHLVHFDHSQAFHELLGRLYEGEIGEANAWLSAHGRELYSAFD